ncbi:MAG: hypothetical protein PWP23_1279 [Candidatus Sumerlaeota bacterium]|nr:hypothetical protein [Candidatus Sumerlaeota bacterium]
MGRPPRKKAIIERSALELFAEHGIDGTSIRMIAEKAGVTEGALYRHHASKDDLVRSLFFQYFERIAELLAQAQESGESVDQKIRAMIRGFFTFYDDDPKGFRFVLLVQHVLLENVRGDMENPVEVIMGVLKKAVKKGEIPKQDVALSAQILLGIVMQTAIGHRYKRVQGPLVQHSTVIADACLRVLQFRGSGES